MAQPDITKVKANIQKMMDLGAPEEDIDAYLSEEGVTLEQLKAPAKPTFGGQMAQPQGEAPEGPGALYRFAKGLKDPIDAGAQMLTRALPDSVIDAGNAIGGAIGLDQMNAQDIDRDITQSEQQYQAERQAGGQDGMDLARMAGQITTTLPLTRVLPAATTIPGAIGVGAGGGALFGLLNPISDPEEQKDFWSNKGEDAAISAGISGPLSGLMSFGGKILGPQVDKGVQYLMDKGITPTMGQIQGGILGALENKATSIPLLGDMIKNAQRRTVEDFNKAALNEVLAPIGKTASKVGREGVEEVANTLDDAFKQILPKLTYQADDVFRGELQNIAGMAKEMPEPQFKQFLEIVKNKLASRLSPQGTMDGKTFKGVEQEFTRLVKGYSKDPSFDQRQLGAALGELQRALRENLTRVNPEFAPELSKINGAWARFAKIRDAASRIGTDEGVFTPSQLQNAVRAGDQSVGKGQFAKGNALMQELSETAKGILSSYPDSGTAGRMMTGGAGLLGLGSVEPISASILGSTMLPYTKTGQKLMADILTKRPELMRQMGGLLTRAAPAGGALMGLLGGSLE